MPCRGNPACKAASRQDAVRGSCARSLQTPCWPVCRAWRVKTQSPPGWSPRNIECRISRVSSVAPACAATFIGCPGALRKPIHAMRNWPFSTAIRQAADSIVWGFFSRTIVWLMSLNTEYTRLSCRMRCSARRCSVMSRSTPARPSAAPLASRTHWPRAATQRMLPSGRTIRNSAS